MASKFGLAGGIPERRVRPIWDAVDSRQYKAALKLCAALLAKHPTSPYVLVSSLAPPRPHFRVSLSLPDESGLEMGVFCFGDLCENCVVALC
jgi:hypothetical protein